MCDKFVTLYLSVRLSYTWQIAQKSAMTNMLRHKLPETPVQCQRLLLLLLNIRVCFGVCQRKIVNPMHDKMWLLTDAQYNGQSFFKLKPLCLSGACVISKLFSWLWSLLFALCNSHTETRVLSKLLSASEKKQMRKGRGWLFSCLIA